MSEAQNKSYQKLLQLLGLCRKSGNLISGTDLVIDAVRSAGGKNAAVLVVCSEKASAGTIKKVRDKCTFYKKELLMIPHTPDEIGHAIGKLSLAAVLAVTDRGLADLILKEAEKLDGSENPVG